jgi:hypothetical protein
MKNGFFPAPNPASGRGTRKRRCFQHKTLKTTQIQFFSPLPLQRSGKEAGGMGFTAGENAFHNLDADCSSVIGSIDLYVKISINIEGDTPCRFLTISG